MSVVTRLALAGGLLVVLLGAAVAVDAWARGPGVRAARRPAPRAGLVALRPVVVRHPAATAPLTRGAAAARALLGAALILGVALHLRLGVRVRRLACAAALLGTAWALGTAFERATRTFDLPYLRVTLGTQSGGFTLYDVYLAGALLLAAVAGGLAARRAPAGDPAATGHGTDPEQAPVSQ